MATSQKCPSCGGNLIFDPQTQSLTCDFCGNSYTPEKLELLLQIRKADQGEAEEPEEDKREIVCDNCGAVVITDKDTAATFCAFCGSPAIVSRRLNKQFRPDFIIPFKITKEEAKEKFTGFARSRKYVPRDFFRSNNLDRIKGIYVPFWVLGSRCKGSVRGEGYKKRIGYRDKYVIMSDFDVKYQNVPFDGSSEIADDLMEAIEPFDVSERKEFNTSYLQGFYAQKFNLTADDLCDRIMVRMEEYARDTAKLSLHDYDPVNIGACAVRPYDLEQMYALFPVWFLNYGYDGGHYSIAINGQTGKADGYLPVDRFKRRLRLIAHRIVDVLCCLLVLIPFAALLFGLYKLGMHLLNSTAVMIVLIVAICIAVPFLVMGSGLHKYDFGVGKKGKTLSELLTGPVTKLFLKRRSSYDRLCNETNMTVGKRPSADEYFAPDTKIEFNSNEMFSGSESIFTGTE